MWCDEVREALPLLADLPDLGEAERAEIRAHAAGCPGCAELLRAYEADEQAFAALRRAPRSAPLAGFADGVMARLAELGPAAPLPVLAVAEPEARLIKLGSWPAVAGLAAALLLSLGLLIATPRTPLPEPGVAQVRPTPAPTIEPGFAVAQEPVREPIQVTSPERTGPPERVPMPRRLSRPRSPAREGSDVVPVDRGSRRRTPAELPPEMKELLERMAPQLQRLFPPPPPPPPRKDEVRF